MGIIDTLFDSAVKVIAGILGFVMLLSGAQQAAFGSSTVGTVVGLLGIILLVFATRL